MHFSTETEICTAVAAHNATGVLDSLSTLTKRPLSLKRLTCDLLHHEPSTYSTVKNVLSVTVTIKSCRLTLISYTLTSNVTVRVA